MIPQLVRCDAITRNQIAHWRALAIRAMEPNPFFEPEYVLALANQRYGGEITLLTVSVGGDMVTAIPLYRRRLRLGGLPVPTWSVPSVLGLPLLDRTCAVPALETAFDFLASRSAVRKVLLMPRAPVDGPVAAAIEGSSKNRPHLQEEGDLIRCPIVRRRRTDTYLDETLHGRRRKNIWRQRNHLEKLLGHKMRLQDHGGSPGAVEKFLALERSGWKGRAGTAMLCRPGAADWFRQVCAAYGAAGRLRLVSLDAGGTTVAMKCDVEAGEGLFNLKTAYNEAFARFSPGVLLEVEAVRVFHRENRYAFMDASSNYPKNPLVWLYPDGRPLADRAFTLGGRAARIVIRGLELSWRTIRSAIRLLHSTQRAEQSR
jgi:CelD/BcsL family acetyltransferase involved in cellulose biosynthesis